MVVKQILQGLTLDIRKGETCALVGPSGCGKSTVIQLVQRFYDVDSGSVQLEGDDIRSLNVGKLRDRYEEFVQTQGMEKYRHFNLSPESGLWARSRCCSAAPSRRTFATGARM